MKSQLIHTRFDILVSASKNDVREIARMDLPQVPAVGETIGINGYPFLVQNRGWAASDDKHGPDDKYALYAYVTVVKLIDFEFKTPGTL